MVTLITSLFFPLFLQDSLPPQNDNLWIKARLTLQAEAIKQPNPIILLDASTLSRQQQVAQMVVVNNPNLKPFYLDSVTQKPMRCEVFSVFPLRPSDYNIAPECADGSCMRVELYNYALNTSIINIVQPNLNRVIRMGIMKQAQPDIPTHLKELAVQIAIESKEVSEALGFKPTKENALMADTKTALNRTRCERSRHLCVAPTFIKGDRALWAIVDLTDLRVAGIRWTNTGSSEARPTERKVQNDEISSCYCEKSNSIERDGWKFNYILTSSDGMRISEVDYNGKRIIQNAKLVDWHVSYSNTDGFGYSDAVGCPFFSSSAVVAIEKPRTEDIVLKGEKVGFALIQNYASEGWPGSCNYNYEQRYEFYSDGRFRPVVASLGRGCGNNGTYRPVTRIVFAAQHQRFEEWTGQNWKTWQKEAWQLQTPATLYTPEGFQYRIQDVQTGNSIAMIANHGQMPDGGRGDQAYVYITRQHKDADEGESDLITIGPCCNSDYRQGPERFMEPTPETLDTHNGDELVFWYVSQLKNDDRDGNKYCWAESVLENGIYKTIVHPCYSGPMFVPIFKN